MDPTLQVSEEEAVEFSIKLEDDELRSRQLGRFQAIRNDQRHQDQPREDVTRLQASSVYVGVRCLPPRYGSAKNNRNPPEDVSATLIGLDLTFQKLRDSRLRHATVEIEVEDAETISQNAHELQIDQTWQPRILRFAPHYYQGEITQAVGHTSGQMGISASDPSQTVKVNGTYTTTTPVLDRGHLSIQGARLSSSEARWTLSENKITKSGMPPEVLLGLLVSCTPGRKFAAIVRITANIKGFLGLTRPVAGEKDDPLFFTPPRDNIMPQESLSEKMDEIDEIDYEAGRQMRTFR